MNSFRINRGAETHLGDLMGPPLQCDSARIRRLDWADCEMIEGMF